jgi:hypothetical protein
VNTLRGSSFSQVDIRVARTFNVYRTYGIDVIGEIFNLLNSKNPVGNNGNCGFDVVTKKCTVTTFAPTAFAGDPGQGEQRLAQIGLRIHF